MEKNRFTILSMVIAFLFTACNNQDYEFQLIETNENFTLDVKMLSFTSQEQLNSFVRQDFFNNVDFGLTTRVNDNTFEFPQTLNQCMMNTKKL
ncbi:MAG: hypothetical protein VB024_02730 [Dysgonamonadaceae bacterium]|jgi:hypothetical protein|nr:hypothetical protein [Dysgonamonadaceae bacterium]MDD3309280.1 hypothetical protein [Dysgonamonadaceae bacterium]MDD4399314.1 hypothetical protein [Dysgonamonadaceae bacterium]MEA5080520.1 hypothetical protein [Dysgonamonadaceae bacterium]